jgi:hypothetical protein
MPFFLRFLPGDFLPRLFPGFFPRFFPVVLSAVSAAYRRFMGLSSRRLTVAVAAVALVVGCGGCAGRADWPRPQGSGHAGGHGRGASGGHVSSPATPAAAPLRKGERFVHLTMPRPYRPVPPRDSTDEYRCFLLDPGFTERTFLTGNQFLPQNPELVHHAIFFRVQPSEVAQARRLDAGAPGDGWTCFGGTGIEGEGPDGQLRAGASWIAAWAPGGRENVIGSRTGFRLEAGSQIVMQIHYNLLAGGGRARGTDRSGIRLRVADGSADLDPLQVTLLPAPVELPCAPGESGRLCDREEAVLDVWHRFGRQAGSTVAGLNLLCNEGRAPVAGPTQRCDRPVREAGTVHSVGGHMHLLGRSIKVELNPGTGRAKTLLDNRKYDFDDQGARPLAEPVRVRPDDTYRVTCTHDAGLRSRLPELRRLQPRYVVWGEGTSDEMCLGIVIWSRPS